MTAQPGPRQATRSISKALLGVLLVLCGVLAPVEVPLLGPPGAALGSQVAQDQCLTVSPWVRCGEPQPCPDGWTAVRDTCRVEQPACPHSPFDPDRLDPDRLMQLSTEYPEFCEETIYATDPDYQACAALRGFAVIDDGTVCRALQLRTCETGSRIDSAWCRATIRRSWRCTHLSGAIPRNQFNTCYVAPGALDSSGPCGPDAPDLVVIDCADYVGNDFVEPPGQVDCIDYYTGSAPRMTDAVNPYWCRLNQSYLRSECHRAAPPLDCTASMTADSMTMCLKRASGTGGCDGMAQTMVCRGLQEKYAASHRDAMLDSTLDQTERSDLQSRANDALVEGCQPCVILPFAPVPEHCPDETHDAADQYYPFFIHELVHRYEQDIPTRHQDCGQPIRDYNRDGTELTALCLAAPVRCDSPTPGNPVWYSTHFSGAAVVNSPVIVQIHDVPNTMRDTYSPDLDTLLAGGTGGWSSHAEFPGTGLVRTRQLVRTFGLPDPTIETDSVASLVASSLLPDGRRSGGTECTVNNLPVFKLVVEELWPDRPEDRAQIENLFGAGALGWWHDLAAVPDAQQRRTEGRGLPWWPDLNTADQQQRIESLQAKIDCNNESGERVWCRWVPARPGYYRLRAAGAWNMEYAETRVWHREDRLRALHNRVAGLAEQQRQRIRDTLKKIDRRVGCSGADASCAMSPAALGLNDALTGILPTSADSADLFGRDLDYLFTPRGESHRFPNVDLRVDYLGDADGQAKYTETQPFGVLVHEVRVSTVTPAR